MSSGLVLNTNINSLVAQNALTSSGTQLAQALEQLSTGLRINTAADDAAGYAIVNGMTSQINGLNQAAENANDGVSLAQTGSGALSEIVNDLQSMRDLAVESLNATNSSADRVDLDAQFQQLKADIDNVASTTQFNGVNLLDGSFQGATFQVGANAGQTITVSSVASAASDNLGQLYTAAATDPTAYTTTGATGGTAVANGDSGTFTLTVGGKQYTTAAVTLTGTQSTDLKAIAAAITEATGDVGVVATVDSSGKGIDLGSTTQQTVTASYSPATGSNAETLATFGLSATSDLAPTPSYAATGGTVTDSLASSGTTTYAATGTTGTDTLSAGTTTYTSTGTTPSNTGTTTYNSTGIAPSTGADADTNLDTGALKIGSTTIDVAFTGNASADVTTVIEQINAQTGTTGVTATKNTTTGGIDLSGTSPVAISFTADSGLEDLASLGISGTLTPTTTGGDADTAGDSGVLAIGTTNIDVSFTGNSATDVANVLGLINAQSVTTGVTATANTTTGGIDLSGTSNPTIGFTLNDGANGEEDLATLGITGTLTPQVANADSGTVSVVIGSTTYTTGTITGFDGTAANDIGQIVSALNTTGSDFQTAGYVASPSGNNLVVTGPSGGPAFTVTSATFNETGTGTGSIDLGLAGVEATPSGSSAPTGTVAVVIGGTTYTTGTITGLDGTAANDVALVASALNETSSFESAGYSASVNSSNQLVVTGGSATFTVTSATYTGATGTGDLDLGINGTAAAPGDASASTSTLADANVKTVDSSNEVLIQVDAALQQLATTGADLGAYQDRFQAAVTGLQTDSTNLSSAKSQIQDTDYAQATSTLTQAQILQQAGTAMVAQANQIPQNVLTLINKLS